MKVICVKLKKIEFFFPNPVFVHKIGKWRRICDNHAGVQHWLLQMTRLMSVHQLVSLELSSEVRKQGAGVTLPCLSCNVSSFWEEKAFMNFPKAEEYFFFQSSWVSSCSMHSNHFPWANYRHWITGSFSRLWSLL